MLVIDHMNQSGITGTTKWNHKSRSGVRLSHSQRHARSIALVLNLQTGHIFPQNYLTFDDEFSTVSHLNRNVSLFNWSQLLLSHTEHL